MFWVNNNEETFDISWSMKHECEKESKLSIEERLGIEELAVVMMTFYTDGIDDYDELISALNG